MKQNKRVFFHLFFLVSFVVLLFGVGLLVSPPLVYAGGQMTLLPASRQVVQSEQATIQIVLEGFEKDESLSLWQTLPDYTVVEIGNYRTNSEGHQTITLNLGASEYPLGTHHISLRSNETGQLIVESFEFVAPETQVSPEVSISVEPAHPRQNTWMTIRGSGYAKEGVSLWLTYPNGKVRQLRYRNADSDGTWDVRIKLAEKDPTGTYYITGRGTMSGRVGVGSFVLRGGEIPERQGQASITVSPSVVRQLEAIEISGSGFEPQETVSLWLTESNGTVWRMRSRIADEDGSFRTGKLRIGALLEYGGSPVGQTTFTAYGKSSKRIAIATVRLLAGSELGE